MERMAAYLTHAKQLLSLFERAKVKQVGGEPNSHADTLANLASAVEAGNKRIVEVETLEKPSIELQPLRQVMCLDLGPSWMDPIIAYLKDEQLPEDKNEDHKIRLKAARFWLFRIAGSTGSRTPAPISSAFTRAKSKTSFMKFMWESVGATLEVGHWHTELSAKATGGPTCKSTPSCMPENLRSARSFHTPFTNHHRI